VGLINSLRLTGHDDPIFIVDQGLEPWQRGQLEAEATVLSPPDVPLPSLARWSGLLRRRADVMVYLDVDIIVVASLDPIAELCEAGKIVGFEDALQDRFFPEEWAAAIGMNSIERVHPYINAGCLAFPLERGVPLLERICMATDGFEFRLEDWTQGFHREWRAHPFCYADQDFFNASLSTVPPAHAAWLQHSLAPGADEFDGWFDQQTLECRSRDGQRPYLLHHWKEKPWLKATPPNAYSRLLPRLLVEADLPIRLESDQLPIRLRTVGPAPSR
jgi:hypothetical protein